MGACCFKPSINEEAAGAVSGGAAAGSSSRQRAGNGVRAGRGMPSDAPGPGNRQLCRKAPVWNSEQPMTLGQLLSKRDEFWDTAPAFNGRPEIWQALRAAAECGDNDTAQAIMSAVDVTLPHGNLSLVYDELGNKYDIPPYCLSEPANLVKNDSSRLPSSGPSAQGPSAPPDASEPADAAAPVLRVRLRLSTNQQVEWSGAASTNVATLKQFIQAEHGIAPDRQRWLFGGQLLTDSSTLASAKVPDDAVVQIMVRSETPP